QQEDADALIALARCGDDTTVIDPGAYFLREAVRSLKGYVYTDRPVYRPGHTVHAKAVLRWMEQGQPRAFDRPQVEIVVSDPDDKVLLREQRPVDRFGSAFTSLRLPATAALGDYTITVNTQDQQATGSFAVEEYRKPEFEVAVTAPQRFYLQGTTATLRVRARYYFGQPVANGRVKYVTYSASYWSPWRSLGADAEDEGYVPAYYGDQESEAEAVLDAQGEATIAVDLPASAHDGDLSIRVEARVTDATGREVSGRSTVMATRGPFVVASQAGRWVYAPGSPARFRARVVDYEGRPQAGTSVRLSLGRAAPNDYSANPQLTPVASATLATGPDGQVEWTVPLPQEAGRLLMVAEVTAGGRTMRSRTYVWVPGKGEPGFDTEDRSVELVADKSAYAPGETATFVVRGADGAAAMLVTKEYTSTMWHLVARVGADDTLEVPITAEDVGDVWVNVAFIRDDRLFVAEKRVRVPPVDRQLRLSVEPAQAVSRPREPGVFTVRALDASGQPVSAQVSLGVVDEAVYGVRPDTTPDPTAFFYRRTYSSVYTGYSRNYAFTGYAGTQSLQLAQRRRPMSLADFKADRPERAPVRKEFPDAIHWVADLVTDATGTATVKVAYPDSLTTWRITARGVTEDTRLGAAVARTTTTKDVIVRAAPPRFLTEGDTVGVPLVAHNYLDSSQPFDVSLTATGVTAAAETPTSPIAVTIPARGEHRSTWQFTAGAVGTATFTGTARTAVDGDAVEISLPVLPYGLVREEGTSGTIAGTAEHALALTLPEASNPAARSIEVTLAPSMAGSMLGALDYLTGYPYGCTEQTLSSFLPNLTVMRAMSSLGLTPGER
ncbi:MAG: MG2 domain-containing protein, partial [Vicinamibacterales bacterium]|nr:MG2 domain-containing protein [Vicinamibacterales bacterium]